MITVRLPHNTRMVPVRWSEMTERYRTNFVELCKWLERYETGRCSFHDLKTGIALSLLGIDQKSRHTVTDTFSENIFRVIEQTGFPYSLSEPDEGGVRTVSITVRLSGNLQPVITSRRFLFRKKTRCRHDFTVSPGGIVRCDIDAALFADTLDLLGIYSDTREDPALDMIFTRYYGTARATRDEKVAFYYNLRGYIQWLVDLPDFSLIFKGTEKPAARGGVTIPLGNSSGIYTLSKAGYGTLEEIKRLPLFEYLNAMVQTVVDNIRELAGMDMKANDIAAKLGLTVDQVLPYITKPE